MVRHTTGVEGCRTRRSVLKQVLLTSVLSSLPTWTAAQGTVPDFQYDPVDFWGARLLIWMSVLSLGVVGYAMWRALRGRLTGVGGKGLLLVGGVVLPSFSVATGMVLVFSRAERVEFCGSCHRVLQPYVDEMTDSTSESLAAVHFRNQFIPADQCYECHTSYGLFGSLEAKIQGVREVMRYYTGTYELPITIWRQYSNADCLKCHARSARWLALEAHTDARFQRDLYEDRTSCMDCHDSAHDVEPANHQEAS